jgi:hypothetical protein
MSPVLIAYLASVALALFCATRRFWRVFSGDGGATVFSAVLLCGFGPITLICLAATIEPRHIRNARRAADIAEHAAREAQADAARLEALGIGA